MLLIWYPKCSTCKNAKAWLENHGISVEVRHIVDDNPSVQELKTWWERSRLPLKRFFNTSGIQYRALGLKDKLATMTGEEQLQLLASDGMLLKRPLLLSDNFVLVGFHTAEWVQTILS